MKRTIKIIRVLIALIVIVGVGGLMAYIPRKEELVIPKPDVIVKNENTKWSACCQSDAPYQISFAKINLISFATNKEDLYIRVNLDGKLPGYGKQLPSYNKDKLTGLIFYINLDENYYDGSGMKTSSGPEARMMVSFYGDDYVLDLEDKINVNGNLIEGGPGYNYFIVKFPYRKLLLNQTGPYIVFNANSLVLTEKFPAGGSSQFLENRQFAADEQNIRDIKINLGLKK